MDLATRLSELQKRVEQHREVLLTEEAAKTALVMPFLQALGYDVFNPAEVTPEFTADVGTKKGEKVDYAILSGGKITMLVECKPAGMQLDVKHASQLYRYFSVTDARVAVLTNGVIYNFYSDVDKPNKMDERPFFSFNLEAAKAPDIKILESFTKASFDISRIVQEAGNLKLQSLLRKELEKEFAEPSDAFIRMMAARVHEGNITQAVKDQFSKLIVASVAVYVRDLVNDRLASALNASGPAEQPIVVEAASEEGPIVTTEEEVSGFRIVQAIASRATQPKRVVMRDQQSYCGILLDNNNRKTVARLHFNGVTRKYLGVFKGKAETKHLLTELTDIYQHQDAILERIEELEKAPSSAVVGDA